LGKPIRVFKAGDRYPMLHNNLFLNFDAHKSQILKSGVFRVPHIPQFQTAYNLHDEHVAGTPECLKYSRVVRSPAHYGKTVHQDVYYGNIFKPASAKQLAYTDMTYRLFPLSDILRKVGEGVYYYMGCRSSDDKVKLNAAQLAAIQRDSDKQQAANMA